MRKETGQRQKKIMFNCYVAGPFCLKDNEMSEPKPPSEGGL